MTESLRPLVAQIPDGNSGRVARIDGRAAFRVQQSLEYTCWPNRHPPVMTGSCTSLRALNKRHRINLWNAVGLRCGALLNEWYRANCDHSAIARLRHQALHVRWLAGNHRCDRRHGVDRADPHVSWICPHGQCHAPGARCSAAHRLLQSHNNRSLAKPTNSLGP